jgi:serine phosphatase RsbU (regulator of sigma subunit)
MPLTNDRLALVVGDASGKGVAAALMIASVQSSHSSTFPLPDGSPERLSKPASPVTALRLHSGTAKRGASRTSAAHFVGWVLG